jgi:hypothetical protein
MTPLANVLCLRLRMAFAGSRAIALFATGHNRVEGATMGPITGLVRKPFGSDDLSKAMFAVLRGAGDE